MSKQDFDDLRSVNEYFQTLLNQERLEKMEYVLSHRSKYLTIVLEDIFQPFNASATLRTAECWGLCDIHVVEHRNKYRPVSGITMGAEKWLNLHRYSEPEQENTKTCIDGLRKQGYRIVATSPTQSEKTWDLESLPLDQPIAVLFGAEEKGLSEVALAESDLRLKLPMFGFTESYNITVSVAIVLSNLVARIRKEVSHPFLSEVEKELLKNEWFRKTIPRGELIHSEFLKRKKGKEFSP
ncbi:tRNA (guanine-N2)-dimethyltransferase [Leptospira perolatii]|uniref:tRNA (guanosine(18)-2'-O)-methyltransferase n=1 Tax=Leptospira perolatii TaxID=2023191 RepID=A0A2M9ZMC8_9LEPT|nr:RNA methyltransferase [Leptospira perolatii]PJZ70048.1 tRNA (guanine-N2)-dimethyltransferase [Leptospira perolatii]PJZ73236.1 tRNA (guanine-N2)-dimethyltransferase [Leptospira perolatii]